MVDIGKLGVVVFGVRDQSLGFVVERPSPFPQALLGGVVSYHYWRHLALLWQNLYPGIKAVESIFASVSKIYRSLLVAPDGHCATVKA